MDYFEILREVKREKSHSLLRFLYQAIFDSSTNALLLVRFSQLFYKKKHKLLAVLLKRKLERRYGLFISLNTEIGKRFKIPHATSIVIGDGVKIGDDVTIYQQVTLGGQNIGDSKLGKYPKICSGVTVYSGAKIIGGITVGEGSTIGANSVVIRDVEANSVYAGVPAKKIR